MKTGMRNRQMVPILYESSTILTNGGGELNWTRAALICSKVMFRPFSLLITSSYMEFTDNGTA